MGISGTEHELAPGQFITLVVTRSSEDSNYKAYLNGSEAPEYIFQDNDGITIADTVDGLIRFTFFIDDELTVSEATSGRVFEIRVWDGPLDSTEIPLALPEVVAPALAQLKSSAQDHVIAFNGVPEFPTYAHAPVSDRLIMRGEFTIEGWALLGLPSKGGLIFGKVEDSGTGSLSLYLNESDGRSLILRQNRPGGFTASSTLKLPLGEWVHLAVVNRDMKVELYANGGLLFGVELTGGEDSLSTAAFSIGYAYDANADLSDSSCDDFSGVMKQVKFWSRPLSEDELMASATNFAAVDKLGLETHWPLDDGSGQFAKDLGPNGLDLILGTGEDADDADPRWATGAAFPAEPIFSVIQTERREGHLVNRLMPIDFDRDGTIDFVGSEVTSDRFLAFKIDEDKKLLEVTDSAIEQRERDTHDSCPTLIDLGDFNGDGITDVIIADFGLDAFPGGGHPQTILIGTEDGRLVDESLTRLPQVLDATGNVSAGDIDNDGDTDVYIDNIAGFYNIGSYFIINDGSGNFTVDDSRIPHLITSNEVRYNRALLVDVDMDSDLDLVLGFHAACHEFDLITWII